MPVWFKAAGIGGSLLALIALVIVFLKQIIAFIGLLSMIIKFSVVLIFVAVFLGIGLMVFRAYNDIAHYVAISDADRHPDLTYAATIHHGIPLGEFTFRERPDDYLLFFGRIHPDKGAREAVELARRTGQKLVIAGIVHDQAYFDRWVRPFVDDDQIRYVGSANPSERNALLGGARALLHLIGFDEPFGLSVVEAMATGTPVIAYPRGSMSELIRDGLNGFLVSDLEAAEAALHRVDELDRRACRADAEARFSAERMVDDYLRLYERIVSSA